MPPPSETLRRLGLGDPLVAWAREAPDLEAFYHACPRGDWLMALALAVQVDRRRAVRAALECAERARRVALPDHPTTLAALEASRRWLGDPAWGARCLSAAFAISHAARDLGHGSPAQHAALAAASVAHGCDADASPVYYARRGHPVRAIAHAVAAEPAGGTAEACADAVRTEIPWAVLKEALPDALRRSAPPPAPDRWEVEGSWYADPPAAHATPAPD